MVGMRVNPLSCVALAALNQRMLLQETRHARGAKTQDRRRARRRGRDMAPSSVDRMAFGR
jgi:hypothetical protein